MEHFYESVDGWFNFREIYDTAVRDAADGAIFVEIGSWYGRSAAYLAVEIANSGKRIKLYCVDTWTGSTDLPWMTGHLAARGGSAFPFFLENMQRGNVLPLIEPIRAPSVEAAERFGPASVDFIMIDGAHDFASVRDDVRAWLPKLKRGGVMAGDDADWPGVLIAVNDLLPISAVEHVNGGANWRFRNERAAPGIWAATRDPATRSDYFAYIPYVNRPDLLDGAVASIPELWPSLAVIDQSTDGLDPDAHAWFARIGGIYRAPRGRMTFSQMMNWAQAEAFERDVDHLVFMHNDAECAPGVATAVLETARSRTGTGVVFTHYDAFAIFRIEALRDVGVWDESFSWYFSDNDYYHRMELKGWELFNAGGEGVVHHGSQTLRADSALGAEVGANWRWHEDHYRHKWGGPPGAEQHSIPYGGRP